VKAEIKHPQELKNIGHWLDLFDDKDEFDDDF